MTTEQPHQDGALKGVLKVVRYGTEHDGHDIEVEFDRRAVLINRARLRLDGELVDKTRIFYGEKELTATTADGHEFVVKIDSGAAGELTRIQLKTGDGTWSDLVDRGVVES